MNKIRLLVMDVDGTLTDGKIYMGSNGEQFKAFDVKDGCGICFLLPNYQIVPVIITARESRILEKRCQELCIEELHQNVKDKLKTLKEVVNKHNINMDSVAYVGDDLPDVPCMEAVKKSGGIVLCPADAIPEIKQLADYVSGCKAGEGAVRDVINYLGQNNYKQKNMESRISETVRFILDSDFTNQPSGKYILPNGNTYMIQEYDTREEEECVLETHCNHIDIQYMISGIECFKTYTCQCLTSKGKYNKDKDVEFWSDGLIATENVLFPGCLIIVYKGQPHKGAIRFGEKQHIRKVVCKIKV